MKLLLTFGMSNDGPEITMQRHTDTLAETEQVLFTKICDMVEPAIYEALRECVRNNLFRQGVCFWDGRKIKMVKG